MQGWIDGSESEEVIFEDEEGAGERRGKVADACLAYCGLILTGNTEVPNQTQMFLGLAVGRQAERKLQGIAEIARDRGNCLLAMVGSAARYLSKYIELFLFGMDPGM